jgi:hypothetical protein
MATIRYYAELGISTYFGCTRFSASGSSVPTSRLKLAGSWNFKKNHATLSTSIVADKAIYWIRVISQPMAIN